jgi:hypothetical protein
MFEHEAEGFAIAGGLLSFNQAVGGALTRLRDEAVFRGQEMETLYLANLPGNVPPRSAMVIGLGDPDSINVLRLERAGRIALREAVRLGARTVALAPDILDAGIVGLKDVGTALLTGVAGAYHAEVRLADLGLSPVPSVRSWTFNVGLKHLDSAEAEYKATFQSLQAAIKIEAKSRT